MLKSCHQKVSASTWMIISSRAKFLSENLHDRWPRHQALGEALKVSNLKRLDLAMNEIGDAGAQALSGAVARGRWSPNKWKGRGMKLAGDSGIMIRKVAARSQRISHTGDLSADFSAEPIFTADFNMKQGHVLVFNLRSFPLWIAVRIGFCDIFKSQALGEALKVSNLKVLDLSYNYKIGDAGAQALSALGGRVQLESCRAVTGVRRFLPKPARVFLMELEGESGMKSLVIMVRKVTALRECAFHFPCTRGLLGSPLQGAFQEKCGP